MSHGRSRSAGTTSPPSPTSARAATLDCTGGWYTEQEWRGVPLATLLDRAGADRRAGSVRVVGVTGYARRFSLDHARHLLLATHVAGEPLDHGHGAPAGSSCPITAASSG